MPATIRLDIVSAERELFSGECEMVVAPGAMGELGILPRHTPLITRSSRARSGRRYRGARSSPSTFPAACWRSSPTW